MEQVLATAESVMQEATKIALAHFRQGSDVQFKPDKSPVTTADVAIEKMVRQRIQDAFPEHEILGEEFGAGDLSKEHVWVIDPIDGTRSFIAGDPHFGILLCYLKNGRNQLSLVSMPALAEFFVSQDGKGTTGNGKPIGCSKKTKLSDAILYINEGDKLFAQEPEILRRLQHAGHTRRFAYDCYSFMLLAAGHIDGVIDYDLKPFDYLPLVGVVEQAGGKITDWQGRQLSFESDGRVVAAATEALHEEILGALS